MHHLLARPAAQHDTPVRRLAQAGAGLLLLAALACGATTGPTEGGDGASGGTSGDGSGGDSLGVGGSGVGGSGAGGETSSGGSGGDGLGGAACPLGSDGFLPIEYPSCRNEADCMGLGTCRSEPPSGAGLCGACFPTTLDCATDEECDDGFICLSEPADPCQCMGGDRVCAPACTQNSCGVGQVCRDDGHCGPAGCVDDGFECTTDRSCDPGRSGADVNGCAPRSCETDGFACPDHSVCDSGGDVVVDSHGCRGISCAEGLVCPANTLCNPEGPGCRQLPCATDADCDCAYCVSGRCVEQPNTCYLLPS